jgi:hypothetical protein
MYLFFKKKKKKKLKATSALKEKENKMMVDIYYIYKGNAMCSSSVLLVLFQLWRGF